MRRTPQGVQNAKLNFDLGALYTNSWRYLPYYHFLDEWKVRCCSRLYDYYFYDTIPTIPRQRPLVRYSGDRWVELFLKKIYEYKNNDAILWVTTSPNLFKKNIFQDVFILSNSETEKIITHAEIFTPYEEPFDWKLSFIL